MHIWKSGGITAGLHAASALPQVTNPRQASASVVQLGVLGSLVVTTEGVQGFSVMASGAEASQAAQGEPLHMAPAVQGTLLAGFDETKNKGLDLAGKAGDPVFASADGRVVYAGAGLRGYGNLIILKHNNTFLTAYAHNQTLLVKEDQSVRKGQKIAEMGSSDADRVKLHFEIRRQGKPVDPAKYLPAK